MGDEDVRIKVAYCAICGSDPHLVDGIFGLEVPFGLGHEMSGVITELGPKATTKGLKVGDRVAGNFLKFCGTCYYCQNKQQQFCVNAGEYNRPCMAEEVIWHESQVYKLPDEVSLRNGCMLEPISVAVRTMDKVQVQFGDRVCICGGGPIGLLDLQGIKMSSNSMVVLIEPIEARRNQALEWGADVVIDPLSENVYERAMELTDGLGFDKVIDASGSPKAVVDLPKITAKGGFLLLGAMYPGDYEMPLNLYKYCYEHEITISGFYVSPYTFPRAAQMVKKFKLDEFTKIDFGIDDEEGL